MVTTSSVLVPTQRQVWVVGSGFDRLVLLGGWVAPFLLMAIYAVSPLAAILAFGLLDGSHVAATLPITLLDRTGDAGTQRFYRLGILTIVVLAIAVSAVGGTAQFVWG